MTRLAKAPLKEIMREEGCEIISEKGLLLYRDEVERYAYALANQVKRCATHAGRKTIFVEDVKLAVE